VPDNVTAQRPTVAVRIPAHPIALALIKAAQVPIAAPSANRFGHVSPTCAQHVLDDLGNDIDYLIDGGETSIGIESTVLDLTTPVPTILRPGGVTYEQLTNVLGEVAIASHTATSDAPRSPGMLPQHYSPRAALFFIEIPNRAAALDMLKKIAENALQQGDSIGLLLVEEDLKLFNGIPAQQASLGSESNLWQAAQRLYAALRFLDDQGVSIILARDLGGLGPGLAIRDRLRRAAKKIIYDAEKPF
jgi:L-threonylcarbamoyladenylate synthase